MSPDSGISLLEGVRYTVSFGIGPGDTFHEDDVPWVRGEFTARFRRTLRPIRGNWLVHVFDNGVLLEGTAWRAERAD
jgi:hypothetical protein